MFESDAACEKCGAVLTATGLLGPDLVVENRYSFTCPFCSGPVAMTTSGVEMALTRYQRPPAMFRRKLRHR